MRIVFLSLEYTAGTFSGNGIYAKSQVRALCSLNASVLVVSARPAHLRDQAQQLAGTEELLEVDVSSWGRLDAHAPWKEYAAGCSAPHVVEAVHTFKPDVILGVDWTSLPAFEALTEAAGQKLPYIYLNYRIFSRTAEASDLELVRRWEQQAAATALDTVVLCRSDAEYLRSHLLPPTKPALAPKVLLPPLRMEVADVPPPPFGGSAVNSGGRGAVSCCSRGSQPTGGCSAGCAPSPTPVDGCSRGSTAAGQQQAAAVGNAAPVEGGACSAGCAAEHDADEAACGSSGTDSSSWAEGRRYLTCCVRISQEKEPHRFVELVEQLVRRGSMVRLGVTPVMCGSFSGEYAEGLKERLLVAWPAAVVQQHFMGPQELAALYRATRLNIHPCSHDAFGMTLVEAASQGAPSIANAGGNVGAADLLLEGAGEVLLLDYAQGGAAALAEAVEQLLLAGTGRLESVAWAAMVKSRSWDEASNARQLLGIVRRALYAVPSASH